MTIPITTTELAPAPLSRSSPRPYPNWAPVAIVIVIVTVGVGVTLGPKVLSLQGLSTRSTTDPEVKPADAPGFDPKTTVVLPDGKLKAAGIQSGAVRREELTTEVGVSGQISLNPDRRVEIKPRVAGVVRSVAVTIGRKVKQGDILVTLDSADVGTARLNLRARQRELVTSRVEADWKHEVNTNVAAIIPELRKGTPTRQLEASFREKRLGTFRVDLLGSYSDFEIASHEEEKQSDLFKQNLVGEHLVFLTKHTREAKQAKFEASLEQVRFDASQQSRLADQQVRAAEAAVIDAAQRLRILGVSEEMARLFEPPPPSAKMTAGQYEDVTIYEIAAPFNGSIVARSAVPSQRVEPTDGLLSLADLTTVRVTANVPESRVGLLTAMDRPNLRVTAAAYPSRTFDATVIYVGEEVDPTTRTVSLLAEMPNDDGQLRPGMFVHINLDSREKDSALTIPSRSVIEIEGKTGVFRPGKDGHAFTFVPVVVGAESNGIRTIVSGLNEGDLVVVSGAFALKSELVLQNESEED